MREKARKNLNRIYDHVWAVYDRDSFPDEDFNNSIFKGKAKNIKCAWSNEAFELWYVLHFQYRNTGMSREDYKKCIESEINKRISSQKKKTPKFTYKKNDPNMYNILQEYGDEKQAIAWAKMLDNTHNNSKYSTHDPCTKVYELIEKLNRIKNKNSDNRS